MKYLNLLHIPRPRVDHGQLLCADISATKTGTKKNTVIGQRLVQPSSEQGNTAVIIAVHQIVEVTFVFVTGKINGDD